MTFITVNVPNVYTTGVPDSKSFDVTLMICLIRNLTSVIPPINGFDKLPLPNETTPGPDLARIKWYRNEIAHHDSDTIDIAYFNTAWSEVSDVSLLILVTHNNTYVLANSRQHLVLNTLYSKRMIIFISSPSGKIRLPFLFRSNISSSTAGTNCYQIFNMWNHENRINSMHIISVSICNPCMYGTFYKLMYFHSFV